MTTASSVHSKVAQLLATIVANLPKGTPLSYEIWHGRHRFLLYLLWAHAFGVAAFAFWMDVPLVQSVVIWSSLAACATVAGLTLCGRKLQSLLVSFGLMTASAWMVYASGGYIEVHFHYFALIPFLALYQTWPPFLLAIGYVGLQHGLLGVFWPHHVYNHPEAWAHPWQWGMIHAGFLIFSCTGIFASWRAQEVTTIRAEASACEAVRIMEASRLVISNAMDGHLAINQGGVIVNWNRQAENIFGWRESEVIGRSVGSHAARLSLYRFA